VARLPAGALEWRGRFPHVLADARQHVDAPAASLVRFGLREIAPIAHPNAGFHPPCQRLQQLAVIDRGGGEVKGTPPPCFVTLYVHLEAVPPPAATLGLAGPRLKSPVLTGPRHLTDWQGRRVWEHHRLGYGGPGAGGPG